MKYVESEVDGWRTGDGGLTNAACDTIAAAAWYCRNEQEPYHEDYFHMDFGTSTAARLYEEFLLTKS